METLPGNSTFDEIIQYLRKLEKRISRIESVLNITPEPLDEYKEPPKIDAKTQMEREEELEYEIGQFWFAKIGINVFIIGVFLLLIFPYKDFPSVLPSVIGYIISIVLFVLARFGRKSFPYLYDNFIGGGMVLFYVSTLRLHFFSFQPFVPSIGVEVLLLAAAFALNLFISLKRESVFLIFVALACGYVISLVIDNSNLTFAIITFLTALTVLLILKYQYVRLTLYGISLTYLSHLVWLINNPVLGREMQLVAATPLSSIALLLYFSLFAFSNIQRGKKTNEDFGIILSNTLNVVFCYGLFLLSTLVSPSSYTSLFHIAASILFLGVATNYWMREKSKYTTFILAMAGYGALSIAIITQYSASEHFIWLCWQSVLVVLTAVWFKSKFIIIANFFIYIVIFLVFIVTVHVTVAALSFGIVALLSARVLNWKKNALELQTEQLRNGYLITAFLSIPYVLYIVIPKEFISISWIGVALLYYTFSSILKNRKYRWMSITTLLMTVLYVLIIDLRSPDPLYKIISFLVLGICLLIMSLLYSRMKKHNSTNKVGTK